MPSLRRRVIVIAAAAGLALAGLAVTRLESGADGRSDALAAENTQAPPEVFDSARAWQYLQQLVAIGPRPAGSAQIREARAYITRQLSAEGFIVEEQPFTASTPYGPVAMVNLAVRLPGRRSDRILFTGHYDTKLFTNQVFVGANDGASSAAFLIELARALNRQPHEYTYELVWFDGEEAFVDWMGEDHTYGSRYYVQAAKAADALARLRAMILVDMIGARDLQIRKDDASTPWLTDAIWAAAKRLHQDGVFVDANTYVEDDHQPFLGAGIPAVDIIDLEYPPWHTPDDDLNHVSAKSLQVVGDVLLDALPDIERKLELP